MTVVTEAYPAAIAAPGTFPLLFEVRNDRPSRLLTLFRIPLLIPWSFVNLAVSILTFVLAPVAWIAIVITGHYPRPLYSMMTAMVRWSANYYAYYFLLTDRYSLFGFAEEPPSAPVRFAVEYPKQSSRMVALFRWFLILPGGIVAIALYFVALLLLPLYWLAIVITGNRPQWLFNVEEGTGRWYLRFMAYVLMLRDEYPPYSMDPDAPVVSNFKAFLQGIALIGAIMSVISQLAGRGGGSDDYWWPESTDDDTTPSYDASGYEEAEEAAQV